MAQYTLLQPLTLNSRAQQPHVHLARTIHSNDPIVIKWLDDQASAVEQCWFKQELKVVQHLTSVCHYSYCLPVLDVGHNELLLSQFMGEAKSPCQEYFATHYLVMPYVKQDSLAAALTKKPYNLSGIQCIFMQLIDAVEALHTCGWLHLDLKPSNILLVHDTSGVDTLAADQRLVLIDFALAQCMNSQGNQPKHDAMTQGTPKYMSPEQFLAQPLNHQTDFYAIGLILYELLIGRLPFHANTYQQWAIQHCQQAVPLLPSSLNRFQMLIDGLLAKDRQHRIQTMKEIRELAHNAF